MISEDVKAKLRQVILTRKRPAETAIYGACREFEVKPSNSSPNSGSIDGQAKTISPSLLTPTSAFRSLPGSKNSSFNSSFAENLRGCISLTQQTNFDATHPITQSTLDYFNSSQADSIVKTVVLESNKNSPEPVQLRRNLWKKRIPGQPHSYDTPTCLSDSGFSSISPVSKHASFQAGSFTPPKPHSFSLPDCPKQLIITETGINSLGEPETPAWSSNYSLPIGQVYVPTSQKPIYKSVDMDSVASANPSIQVLSPKFICDIFYDFLAMPK
ncbi:hypothetical protein Ciccas_001898 [Cichlidogyrus casuarinus]|uniref:Uncharacterized protein n=1 Tax=Cichlidogyrus casuarinus TaxID=1844966 RepID=A0ABD2QIR3_9PLAT